MKKERKSGIELLRILAACAVVILHYYNADMGGAAAVMGGGRKIVMDFLICLCCCAVDVFVLISGYFLTAKQNRSFEKPFSLYLQVVLFSFVTYGVMLAYREVSFNPLHVVSTFVPHNYFVVLYTALYFVSPLLNRGLMALDKKQYQRLLIVAVFLFSVYNSGVDLLKDLTGRDFTGSTTISIYGTQQGYNFVNFALLYVIGGYLNRFGFPRFIKSYAPWLGLVCMFCIFVWRVMVRDGQSATSYANPFVILLSICLLCFFSSIKWKSRVINNLAGAAFTCYLFHLVLIGRIGVKEYAAGSIFIFVFHFISSVVGIYLISFLINKLYNWVFSPILKRLGRIQLSYDNAYPLIGKLKE